MCNIWASRFTPIHLLDRQELSISHSLSVCANVLALRHVISLFALPPSISLTKQCQCFVAVYKKRQWMHENETMSIYVCECEKIEEKMPTICLHSEKWNILTEHIYNALLAMTHTHIWLDEKCWQTKPTKLKVNKAKNELTHNIIFDNTCHTNTHICMPCIRARNSHNHMTCTKRKSERTQNDKRK